MTVRSSPRFLSVLLLAMAAASCTGFRAVGNGDSFRGPQLEEDALARHIEKLGIKTVLCLRSDGEGHQSSERAALGTGIDFVCVPMTAVRLPQPETLLALWKVFDTAERPLMIHCRAGVDRTGLASALLVLHDSGNLEAARGELAFLPHGHLGWFGTSAMDEVLTRYSRHADKLSFPEWVRTVYAGERAEME